MIQIDWHQLFDVLRLVVPAGVGALLAFFFQRRPRLQVFYGHVALFRADVQPAPLQLHTHAVIIKNAGNAAAHNLRVLHAIPMPNIDVHPPTNFVRNALPGGAEEIVFEVLTPKMELKLSYLYYPPILWRDINLGVRSDEAIARFVPMRLSRQFSQPVNLAIVAVFLVGIVSILYLGLGAAEAIYRIL